MWEVEHTGLRALMQLPPSREVECTDFLGFHVWFLVLHWIEHRICSL